MNPSLSSEDTHSLWEGEQRSDESSNDRDSNP